MNKEKYTFGEKEEEYDVSSKEALPVWQSPKYIESKKKVIEMIESKKYNLSESDFWILMNKTKTEKMAYTGLIISHNGCLKINDSLEEKLKFKPSSVKENKEGYEESLVYTYSNDEQGIYEVGEISSSNYRQKSSRYPYAMAFKRLFDRVVLKNSKLAYAGVYSDSEAEELTQKEDDTKTKLEDKKSEKEKFYEYMDKQKAMIDVAQKQKIKTSLSQASLSKILKKLMVESIDKLTWSQAREIENKIREKENEKQKDEEEAF